MRGIRACITSNMHIVIHKICISGNAYTHVRVHMHIRITDCFFPQHLLMWVSLTSSPEHTARQCRNSTFPAIAVKWQNYCYCCCGPLVIACITVNMHIFDELRACINGNVCVQMNEWMNAWVNGCTYIYIYIYMYFGWKMWFWHDFRLKHVILTWLLAKQCDFDKPFN